MKELNWPNQKMNISVKWAINLDMSRFLMKLLHACLYKTDLYRAETPLDGYFLSIYFMKFFPEISLPKVDIFGGRRNLWL